MCFGTPDLTCPNGFSYGEVTFQVADIAGNSGYNGSIPRTTIATINSANYLTMSFCCGSGS